ncbi:hypothetical protein AAFN85_14840 [Mucilaginibacter sp. CAU 1740]|uniref:hypothetical protein n=1 Tax=Mucilaginibacter sp. CAU 1740 TaxID=3140365 RepID=UPI00325B0351
MALIAVGKSVCFLCNEVITEDTDYGGFPHFVPNKNDELFAFSDSPVHIDCVNAAPNGAKANRYADEFIKFTRPENRKCLVTGELITKYEDHIVIGYLTSDEASPLHRFNFRHIHRNNLARWADQVLLLSLLLALKESEDWKHHYGQLHLSNLINSITI